jgi:hypothetical protein
MLGGVHKLQPACALGNPAGIHEAWKPQLIASLGL